MKQIIVNVIGLSEEEKQRVNKALAKITGATKLPAINSSAGWLFAPSSSGANTVSWGWHSLHETPTHTPQKVLEMAGMAEKRKVRADFDPKQSISVDVSNCTEEEKKQVQQAFYDVGLHWECRLLEMKYQHLDALQYTNTNSGGMPTRSLLTMYNTEGCNMTPAEFLDLVYEPEQRGHVHAHHMALYAEDAKTTDKPWELWQYKDIDGNWNTYRRNPLWCPDVECRRKPKNHIVHGAEVPDLRIEPKAGDSYYLVNPTEPEFFNYEVATGNKYDSKWIERGLCYEPTEEGKQAAILHAKAWLGIA